MTSEYVTLTEEIERRTYLRGRLSAKFIGFLDQPKSDLKIENFYDIEILEAKIFARRADLRPWYEGNEHEEFIEIDRFATALPDPIPCEIKDEKDECKYYNLHLFSPKIIDYKIFNQLYEKERLFAVIEGEISGYLRHYDTEEKQVEVIKPELELPEAKQDSAQIPSNPLNIPNSSISWGNKALNISNSSPAWRNNDPGLSIKYQTSPNQGCAPQLGCSVLPGGCLSLICIIFVAYLFFGVIAVISSAFTLFTGFGPIVSFSLSIILPLFIVSSAIYIFVKLQNQLSIFWKWFLRFLILLLIFFLWLN